jgi:hypothetical protein
MGKQRQKCLVPRASAWRDKSVDSVGLVLCGRARPLNPCTPRMDASISPIRVQLVRTRLARSLAAGSLQPTSAPTERSAWTRLQPIRSGTPRHERSQPSSLGTQTRDRKKKNTVREKNKGPQPAHSLSPRDRPHRPPFPRIPFLPRCARSSRRRWSPSPPAATPATSQTSTRAAANPSSPPPSPPRGLLAADRPTPRHG